MSPKRMRAGRWVADAAGQPKSQRSALSKSPAVARATRARPKNFPSPAERMARVGFKLFRAPDRRPLCCHNGSSSLGGAGRRVRLSMFYVFHCCHTSCVPVPCSHYNHLNHASRQRKLAYLKYCVWSFSADRHTCQNLLRRLLRGRLSVHRCLHVFLPSYFGRRATIALVNCISY